MTSVNRRAYPRVEEVENAMVTVKSAPDSPQIEGQTFACLMEDISARGLKMAMFEAPPVNSTLELSIGFKKPVRAFRHTGRVAWVKEAPEEGTYEVGVQFTETPKEILSAWERAVDDMVDERGALE